MKSKGKAKANFKVKSGNKAEAMFRPTGAQTRATAQQPAKAGKRKEAKEGSRNLTWIWLGLILVATFLAYLPALQNGFVWDDNAYIENNPLIYTIDLGNIFSSYLAGNYHPLTVLVHAIEYQLFKMEPAGYHFVNILIHVLNTAMVFYFMRRLTANHFVALGTAMLFGLHPMHVESVAWISELKDVLYSFFFISGLLAYLHFIEKKNAKWFAITILLFLLSVLSKGMAVSFAVVLVLIDIYKGRWQDKKVWMEKIPFFILALVFGLIAIQAQQSESALHADTIGLAQRVVFACYGYVMYLQKLLIPFPLSAYYAYPVSGEEAIPPLYYIFPLIVIGLAVATILSFRKNKKIFFGIAFFTATIFLVLKFLPVGYAVMADRYSYIPSIGIFYLISEGLCWLFTRPKVSNAPMLSTITLVVLAIFFGYQTYARTGVWKNSLTLWSDVIEKDPRIAIAYGNRSIYYSDNKMYDEAEADLNKSLELNKDYADGYYNRGVIYQSTGRANAALTDFNKAIAIKPNYAKAYINRANIYRDNQNFQQALDDYNKGLELDPNVPQAYNNRGILYQNQNQFDAAVKDYSYAIQMKPDYVNAYINRGNTYLAMQNYQAAQVDYNKAIELNPKNGMAVFNRGHAKLQMNDRGGACADFQSALQLGYQAAGETIKQFCGN